MSGPRALISRNLEIYNRWKAGETMSALGKHYAVSHVRIHQIVHRERARRIALKCRNLLTPQTELT